MSRGREVGFGLDGSGQERQQELRGDRRWAVACLIKRNKALALRRLGADERSKRRVQSQMHTVPGFVETPTPYSDLMYKYFVIACCLCVFAAVTDQESSEQEPATTSHQSGVF